MSQSTQLSSNISKGMREGLQSNCGNIDEDLDAQGFRSYAHPRKEKSTRRYLESILQALRHRLTRCIIAGPYKYTKLILGTT